MPTTMLEIREFLSLKRIALVGMSRDPTEFSHYLFRDMRKKGYDIVPVNPAATELGGTKCFGRVQDIDPPVEGVLILTTPAHTMQVVRDCHDAGIRFIWMHRSGGQGSVSPDAVDFCRQQRIHLVEGYCPFMFLPNTSFFHRAHGFILKIAGAYPAKGQRAA